MAKSNLTAFGSFSQDAAKRAKAEAEAEANEFVKVKEGSNRFRILPPVAGSEDAFRKVFTHYIAVPGRDGSKTINMALVCPRRTKQRGDDGSLEKTNNHCAICEACDELRAKGNPLDKNRAYEMRPQLRVFANVIDRKDPTQTVKVWGMSTSIHKALIDFREGDEEEDDSGVDYTDPVEGFDVIIKRTGTGLDTEYKVKLAKKSSPLAHDADGKPDFDAMNEMAESLHDLDKYAALPTDETLRAALEGKDNRRSDDDDDDDFEPRKRKSLSSGDAKEKRAARRKVREEAIEAEFDDDDDDDDDLPEGM